MILPAVTSFFSHVGRKPVRFGKELSEEVFQVEKVDKELMDKFVPRLKENHGHLAQGPTELPLVGSADQRPNDKIAVHVELPLGEVATVVDAMLDEAGQPIRIEVMEKQNGLTDKATVYPKTELEREKDKPHLTEGIRALLENPEHAVNAAIRLIDRLLRLMLTSSQPNGA